jgi:DNA-binding SARP family transcriptional activator
MLDGFEVRHGDTVVKLPPCAERLVAFVALNRRARLRMFVAGSLWLESSQQRANASLRSTLWRLQQAGCEIVEARNGRLRIAEGVRIDLVEVGALARRALDPEASLSHAEVRCLYGGGDLLPDWYEEWIAIDRERFRQLRVHALEALCERFTAARRFGEAAEAALTVIQTEPLRESGHRALIRMHVAEGNHYEARRHYELTRQLLRTHLGTEPSEELSQIVPLLQEPVTVR